MNLAITIGLIAIFLAGLLYVVLSNPLPSNEFEEYACGGRSFSTAFVTMTIFGAWFSGSLFICGPQQAATQGMVNSFQAFYSIGSMFVLYFIAGSLWKIGKKYHVMSMGQYFEVRYESKFQRPVIAIIMLLLEFPWVFTELLASGYAVQAITYNKIPFNVGLVIISVLIIGYIAFGGVRTSVIADYYKSWMYIFTGLVLFLVVVYKFGGGFTSMFMKVRSLNADLLTIPGPAKSWGGSAPGSLFWPSLIIMGCAGSFMYPSLFSKFFVAKSTKDIKESSRILPFIITIFLPLFLWIGFALISHPEFMAKDSQYAFINMVESLGPVASGIIAILILCGSVSMMDSMLSAWSVVFANDVVSVIKPDTKSETLTKWARIYVVVMGFLGMFIAMRPLPTIIQMVTRMSQGAAQVFPAVILGIYWKRGNKYSAFFGTATGLAITAYCAFNAPDYLPALNGMQGGLLALIINFAVYIALGFVKKPSEKVEQVFRVLKAKDTDLEKIS